MKTLLPLLTAGLTVASFATADEAAVEWPECFCTDRDGARHALGEVLCMEVDGRQFIARCEMAQNNPFWREKSDGCFAV